MHIWNYFYDIYYSNWIAIMRSKLGIFNEESQDKAIIEDLLNMMEKYNINNNACPMLNQFESSQERS